MSITPDMLSRPPGPGEIFCMHHGIARDENGGCADCAAALKSGDFVSCPNHGLNPATCDEDGKPLPGCPVCGEGKPAPNPTFPNFNDVAPTGVSPKLGTPRRPAA